MSLVHIGTELRRFGRGKLPPLALLVIILMPLLFGGLFVWSYWDPIGRMPQFPVALVNSDEGAKVGDKQLNAGDQIVEKLLETKAVDFHPVSAQQAREGVEDGTYYFAIEFPTDFSQAVASVNTDSPHQATMHAVYDNTNGLLATTLGNQVVMRVLSEVNDNLGEKIVDQLIVGFETINQGLDKAGHGAEKLHEGSTKAGEGAAKLNDGAEKLSANLDTAAEGAAKLNDGAQQLNDGLGVASNGSEQLAQGLEQLSAATDRLGDGAGQVAAGVDTLVGGATRAVDAQNQALAPLINLSTQLRQTGIPQAIQLAQAADDLVANIQANGLGNGTDIVSKLNQLNQGAAEIHRQLTDPEAQYRGGVDKAAEAARTLALGLHKLNDGSEKLVLGTRTLADGTSKLAAGSQQLTVGANQLATGLVSLDEGTGELALKLNQSAEKIPNFGDNAAQAISTPVKQVETRDSMGLFGQGLAPMFISLGLFMGGTVTFMLLHPLQRRAIDSGATPIRGVLASYLPAAVVGIAQATVMFLVQRFGLGMHAEHELGLLLAMCLTSVVFMTITQGLNAVFGATVGRVLCIGLMTLQIVSSGGLYPPETQPAPLRWFHTYDPMTYSVNLLREMIFTTDYWQDPRTLQAIMVLFGIGALFLTASTLAALRDRQWRMKDFRPEVSV
ncbi:YhgE/Pip domain-containing protein [Corynebacterium felinum]|uniref:Membrane protein n=1 Tax=Corynebacterium felinum TaxID=131318 RepID=A0ABU2BDH6_9CORY|nr:YhgE/Pip domain-containing protein [Corynebacterium felinum]MDF5821925.1 YhgE/Pip domain-containing protein [Corynebacterium felinum]MDR7355783.1 putative membrane protein [Corynebacterium felinum]WJY95129.1 ABC-2 family transporter protein [Corynebacterium felinum]